MSEMKDTKPYIVKALYDWILDNGMTPQIIIHTCFSGLDIPENLKGDMNDVHRRVLLNIGPSAIAGLSFDLKGGDMRFFARFSGSSYGVRIPIRAIESIYAKETGNGHVWEVEFEEAQDPTPSVAPARNHLRIVK